MHEVLFVSPVNKKKDFFLSCLTGKRSLFSHLVVRKRNSNPSSPKKLLRDPRTVT